MYTDLAEWWPLLSPPADYAEEAVELMPHLVGSSDAGARLTLLELGSGGGSLASHFKNRFAMTLTDISPQMLAVNRRLNPESEHLLGDMRTLELGRQFDAVLVYDAIMYATEPEDVRATLRTAARHCKRGGMVAVVPDFVRETFQEGSEMGGQDAPDGRGLRYLGWCWDPDPGDHTYEVAYAFLMRHPDGSMQVDSDRHVEGCFATADWLRWFEEAGLQARTVAFSWCPTAFVAVK
jgi:SAM-dependent methyltransferase